MGYYGRQAAAAAGPALGAVLVLAVVSAWPWMLGAGPVVTWLVEVLWLAAVAGAIVLLFRLEGAKRRRQHEASMQILVDYHARQRG